MSQAAVDFLLREKFIGLTLMKRLERAIKFVEYFCVGDIDAVELFALSYRINWTSP